MKIIQILRNRVAALSHDILVIPIAWFGAYWLRFNLEAVPAELLRVSVLALPIVIGVQGGCFWFFGLYRGIWRFASMPDLVRIIKAIVVGTTLTAALIIRTRSGIEAKRQIPRYK